MSLVAVAHNRSQSCFDNFNYLGKQVSALSEYPDYSPTTVCEPQASPPPLFTLDSSQQTTSLKTSRSAGAMFRQRSDNNRILPLSSYSFLPWSNNSSEIHADHSAWAASGLNKGDCMESVAEEPSSSSSSSTPRTPADDLPLPSLSENIDPTHLHLPSSSLPTFTLAPTSSAEPFSSFFTVNQLMSALPQDATNGIKSAENSSDAAYKEIRKALAKIRGQLLQQYPNLHKVDLEPASVQPEPKNITPPKWKVYTATKQDKQPELFIYSKDDELITYSH